jgi:hypothetical protein
MPATGIDIKVKVINVWNIVVRTAGREGLSGEETIRLGTYNALLKTCMPKEFQYYKAEEETFESSHEIFGSAFPRGFAWEVLCVYTGPPEIVFKFRHWGFFEGPFNGHAPTGEMTQFFGFATLKVRNIYIYILFTHTYILAKPKKIFQ